jgi:hypothetical protein
MTTQPPKITFDELVKSFTDAGWRSEKTRDGRTLLYKMLRRAPQSQDTTLDGLPVCASNDHLSIHATIHESYLGSAHQPPEDHYRTVEFDITGEYSHDGGEDLWAKLSVYSVTWDQAPIERDRIEVELLAAWDAICALRRRKVSRLPEKDPTHDQLDVNLRPGPGRD